MQISCVPTELVKDCIDVLNVFQFESRPEFEHEEGLKGYSWIISNNISLDDAHEATALCFGYCYGREDLGYE
jgi:hypothetical protein